jgi:uncharacterized protein (TIGR02145 family)
MPTKECLSKVFCNFIENQNSMRLFSFVLLLILLVACQDENQPPAIYFTSPLSDTTLQKGPTISISVDVIDEDGISEVVFLLNEEIAQISYELPFIFNWDTKLYPAGEYKFSVYAVDNEGLSTAKSIQVILEVPNISIKNDTVKSVSYNQAEVAAEITSSEGAEVTEYGICWSTLSTPEITDNKVATGKGVGSFLATINGLEPNKTYYARVYAINKKGIVYGEEIVFKTPFEIVLFTDTRDGHTYKTVKIGNQFWFAENLAYLPNVTVPGTGSDSVAYNYVYNQTSCGCLGKARDNENYKTYGTLYNWTAAQKVCPSGWHLPDNDEWEELANYISDDMGELQNIDGNWQVLGEILKSESLWENEGNGTNDYGFGALPGGIRDLDSGEFIGLTFEGVFWSSSETDTNYAFCRSLNNQESVFFSSSKQKASGFSVRCVKD